MKTKQQTLQFRPMQAFHYLRGIEPALPVIPSKEAQPSVCQQCRAVFINGRWCWRDIPANADSVVCPACHRINQDYPAGYVTFEGPFYSSHSQEVMNLVSRHCAHEQAMRPLKRIIGLESNHNGVLITTTDIHLARSIGELVKRVYQGDLHFHFNSEENLLRVHWFH